MKPSSKNSNLHLLPIIFTIVAMALLFAGLIFDWMGEAGRAAGEYCEASRNSWIRQPSNSWSNLGFITVGWIIGLQPARHGRFYQSSFYPAFYSCMAVFLGVGSFAYHASTTDLGGYLDIGSMYLLSSFMLTYALMRLLKFNELVFAGLFVTGLVISFYVGEMTFMLPGGIDSGSMIFGLFLTMSACIEIYQIVVKKISIEGKWAVAFILTFLVSTFIWSRSRTGGIWCDPGSLLQGHAIWHLLDASCVYFIYRYYRSED